MTFKLENEIGIIPEQGDCAFWITLKGPEGERVEGKYFVSGEGQKKLIVFEPGMPGDGNKWMEERFVPELIRQGYCVFCVRHGGTKLDTEEAGRFVNCSERIAMGKEKGSIIGQVAGKTEYTLADIDDEPRIAIEALHKQFEQLYLIGHSGGAEGIALSLPKLPREITDKIRSFISLAGYIGRYDEENDLFDAKGIFDSGKMRAYYEHCKTIMAMGDSDENVKLKKEILQTIYRSKFPENINLVLVNSPKDEYVDMESSREFRDLVGRGLRIIDETQSKPDFHDLKNLQPKTLLRLLNIYHPKRKHTVTVKKET